MNKLLMLGTGHGTVMNLYNTCFVIQNEDGNFLVDSGGSIEVIKRLKHFGIGINEVKHIFISHCHNDHILGLIWIIKGLFKYPIDEENKLNIYCNDEVYEAIIGVAKLVIQPMVVERVYKMINFHVLKDNEIIRINGVDYTFFDVNARGSKQYGFECLLNNKKLVFLGDEPLSSKLCSRVENAHYVTHEAFCLESEEHIFKAHQKNHSTVKSACEIMQKLNVKNLILYHTEESHQDNRKNLYCLEAKQYYTGNIFVPNDLDIIEIL